jgi:hypothetical protein
MKTVWLDVQNHKDKYKNILKKEDIYPVDKMDIDPFLKITHPSVTSLLQSSDDL